MAEECFGGIDMSNNQDSICTYIAKHKNQEVRMKSRSGAFFVAVSDIILSNNGCVYGCILDQNNKVIHARATNKVERDKMCKSKYAQSKIGEIYNLVEKDLKEKRHVLFSGTGCQVQGLLNYLDVKKVDRSLLSTIDIVCHGVASPRLFREYIGFLQKKYHGPVEKFEFRDKTIHGWDDYIESFVINGKKYKDIKWRGIFNSDLCLRPSCYECRFATVNRKSDFTIADAWGIKQADPDFNDNRGVSFILANSEKAFLMLEEISDKCEIRQVSLNGYYQGNLKSPTKIKNSREDFWKLYSKDGIEGTINEYGNISLKKRIKSYVKYKLRQIIQRKKYYLP